MGLRALWCLLASGGCFLALSGSPLKARELAETATPQSAQDLRAIEKRVQKILPAIKRATVAVIGSNNTAV